MIPERVEAVTSVTCGRSRRFSTPVGRFSHRMIPPAAFRVGMDKVEIGEERSCLMAVPEKAPADKLRHDRGRAVRSQRDLQSYLFDALRIDPASLQDMK